MKLRDYLAKVYDRTQRREPTSKHTVLQLLLDIEEVVEVVEKDPPEGRTASIPVSAYWAEGPLNFNPSINVRWGEGIWT